MKSLKHNIFFKVSLIAIIGLLLLIPAAMIRGLISEREYTQKEAIREVSSKWGQEQTLSGPFLTVPFLRYVKQITDKDSSEKIVQVKEYLHFLPSNLKINGRIFPERRNRGIYQIVVYNSKINFSGIFDRISVAGQDIPLRDVQFDKAFISIGISDLRGIEKPIQLQWNQTAVAFNPGTVTTDVIESGINAPVTVTGTDSLSYTFSFDLDLKGSQLLYFIPVGEVTDVTMSSTWATPSFNGAFLPDNRTVSDTGFSANWNVLHLNRNFPQAWVGSSHNVSESAFGIDLLLPVDNYQKATRAIKYAILFIAFTFLVFFLSRYSTKPSSTPFNTFWWVLPWWYFTRYCWPFRNTSISMRPLLFRLSQRYYL